jgi:hypothetical protein
VEWLHTSGELVHVVVTLVPSQAAYASALDDCNESLSMKPKYVKVLMRRATVLDKLEKLDEALAGLDAVPRSCNSVLDVLPRSFIVSIRLEYSSGR